MHDLLVTRAGQSSCPMERRELRPRDDLHVNYRALHLTGEQTPAPKSATARISMHGDNSSGSQDSSEADVMQVIANMAAPPEDLGAWAQARHLTADTVRTLEENGCNNVAIVTAMETSDVAELKLNLGQRRMLLPAIQEARGPTASAATSHPQPPPQPSDPRASSNPEGDDASQPPAQSLTDIILGRTPSALPCNPVNVDDPEIYLHMAAGKSDAHHYDIIDFVPGDVIKDEDSVLACSDGVELIARAAQSKRGKLYHITPAQWSAANSAIMARLIRDGALGTAGVNQYLNYSFKVGDLGRTYTWSSILQYDREYHQLQARLGFVWGTDISHLRATTLIPKQWAAMSQPSGRKPTRKPGFGAGDSGANMYVCRDYNKGTCQRPVCKYSHRCSVRC